MSDRDLEWLLSLAPQQDLLGITKSHIRGLAKLIDTVDQNDLPLTIGLFGNRGCGKTTCLAYLAR